MGKLHYCFNGAKVTEQVIKFQRSRSSKDYLPIQLYYDNYKDQWFNQLEDYMDRATFESEFDYKLCRAIDSFDGEHANRLAETNGWSFLGAFNRWFYKILSNWKSNIKTSSFRMKKRPAVQCPICGRHVGRIDVAHLEHYKSVSDLPKFFVHKNTIYETMSTPRVQAVSWGVKTHAKWKALKSGDLKSFAEEKRRIEWPWTKDGKKMVICPFTRKMIPVIDEQYIQSLPDKYSRYAPALTWEKFIEEYPRALIQSEIFSLDHVSKDSDEQSFLRDHVSHDARLGYASDGLEYANICKGEIHPVFEHSFVVINECISNETDRDILKMVAAGYSIDDISEFLSVDRREIRKRLRYVRDNNSELREKLVV